MGKNIGFMKDSNARAGWAEARFMICAAEHGFNVSRPWNDSLRYDFALERCGEFLRVQVKSTTSKRVSSGGYVCDLRANRRLYRARDLDFFAVYVIPEDAWYIIPVSVGIRAKALWLWPYCNGRHHKYDRYLEAWNLLTPAKLKAKSATSSG